MSAKRATYSQNWARWIRLAVATVILSIGAFCQFTLAALVLVCTPSSGEAGEWPGYGCVEGERICGGDAVLVCQTENWTMHQDCSKLGGDCIEPVPGQAACETLDGMQCEDEVQPELEEVDDCSAQAPSTERPQ